MGEVEAGVEAESHDGGGGAGGADSGEEAEDSGLRVEADVVIALGEWEDGVEVLTLDPVLVFARGVAGVGSLLEHVDDYYFYFDGLLLREAQVVAASRRSVQRRRMSDGSNSGCGDGGVERLEITEPRVVAALSQCGIPATEWVERHHDECPDEIDER